MKQLFYQALHWIVEEVMPSMSIADSCEAPDEQQLEYLYKLFARQDLAHIIAMALDRRGFLPQGKWRDRYTNSVQNAVFRYEQSEYDLSRISQALEKANIPFLPLKGAVIRPLYAQPWMRTSCDLDILVHEEDLDHVIDLLVDTCGFTTDHERHYHNVSLFSESGGHLELHFSILEATPRIDRLLAKAWEYATPTGESSRYQLSNEFMMFYLIAHMSRHFVSGGCGIKPLLDLYLLNRLLPHDTEAVRAMVEDCGIETFYDTMLQLVDVWFADGFHTPLTEACENYLLEGGMYGTRQQKHAANKDKYRGVISFCFNRIFSPYDELKILYPELQERKWLYPFLQVKRWCRLFDIRFIRRQMKEIDIVRSVEDGQRDAVANMMNKLGL